MRKGGGEEARSLQAVRDVCEAHGDRAAVTVSVLMRRAAAFAKMGPTLPIMPQ